MKTVYKTLPAVIFVAFLVVMTFGLLLLPPKEYSENEKRYLAKTPVVDLTTILNGKAQTALEDYTSDHIPGRDFFVGVNAYWTLLLGRNGDKDILWCADDYLINAPEADGGETFSSNLERFEAFAQGTGKPADLLIVPSAGYIMEEVLPAFHKNYQDDAYFAQAEESLSYIRLLDVRQALREGAAEGQVCYRTDHHLTSYGNYLLYRSFQTALGKTSLAPEDYQVERWGGFYGTTWSGSGYWHNPADTVELWKRDGFPVSVTFDDAEGGPKTENRLFYRENMEGLDKYPAFLDGNHSLVTIQNPDAPGGNLLLIRDSYAHCFATFLAEHYKTIYLVDLRYYRSNLSEFIQEHPVDRLLFLYGIDNLLTDTNAAWLQ